MNILRPVLDSLIRPNQSSFLPGRSTTDNIIVSQEILHSLMKTKCKDGGMILQIDFKKAYDKVN